MLQHVMDVMSLTFFERKKFGLFEGAVVSLFVFDSRRVVKYVDAVCLPSFVSERLTGFSVQRHAFLRSVIRF